jgi:hypothetical protein
MKLRTMLFAAALVAAVSGTAEAARWGWRGGSAPYYSYNNGPWYGYPGPYYRSYYRPRRYWRAW